MVYVFGMVNVLANILIFTSSRRACFNICKISPKLCYTSKWCGNKQYYVNRKNSTCTYNTKGHLSQIYKTVT